MMASRAGTYIEMLYDYTYKGHDGWEFTVFKGDQCLLLKKANADWWSVVKAGEKRPIYVPANYAKEIPRNVPADKEGPVKQDSLQDEVFENGQEDGDSEKTNNNTKALVEEEKTLNDANTENQEKQADEHKTLSEKQTDEKKTVTMRAKSTAVQRPKSVPPPPPDKPKGKIPPVPPEKPGKLPPAISEKLKAKPVVAAKEEICDKDSEPGSESIEEISSSTSGSMELLSETPGYVNLSDIQQHIQHQQPSEPSSELGNPLYVNVAEAQMKGLPATPQPPLSTTYPVKECDGNWAVYVDEASGRQFYYNSETKESTWKPPRGLKFKDSAASDDSGIGTSQSDKRFSMPVSPSLPIGWCEEHTENGEVVYKNEVTNDRWLSSVDDSGRIYFYREDNTESAWSLPESPTPPEGTSEERDKEPSPRLVPARIRELEGSLNRTKIMENGKKVKKNWALCYVVTNGPNLFVYKDQKAAAPKPSSPHGKPELCLDLQGATVIYNCQDKSSRKNVFQISTSYGAEYLFQHDVFEKSQEWYITLLQNISLLGEKAEMSSSQGSLGSLDDPSDLDRSFHEEKIPSSPTLKMLRKQNKKTSSLDRNAAVDDPSLSQAEKNVKIRDRLRLFFTRRPDIEYLKQQGIIKDVVFGSTLQRLYEKEKTLVPKFVTACMAAIEKRGLSIDGVYRVSGNLAQIQKLRFMVDQNGLYDLDDPEIEVHVLCGALKLFFRELKEPLIPTDMFDRFLDAVQHRERQTKIRAFKDLLKAVPKPNRETIKELFLHLNKVMKESSLNRMHSQNIAIVFGPTLMWPEQETPNMAVTLVQQNQIVEFILLEYKQFF